MSFVPHEHESTSEAAPRVPRADECAHHGKHCRGEGRWVLVHWSRPTHHTDPTAYVDRQP